MENKVLKLGRGGGELQPKTYIEIKIISQL